MDVVDQQMNRHEPIFSTLISRRTIRTWCPVAEQVTQSDWKIDICMGNFRFELNRLRSDLLHPEMLYSKRIRRTRNCPNQICMQQHQIHTVAPQKHRHRQRHTNTSTQTYTHHTKPNE